MLKLNKKVVEREKKDSTSLYECKAGSVFSPTKLEPLLEIVNNYIKHIQNDSGRDIKDEKHMANLMLIRDNIVELIDKG